MRCKACNTVLNDIELKRRDRETGEFVDLCHECFTASEQALFEAQEESCEIFTQWVEPEQDPC